MVLILIVFGNHLVILLTSYGDKMFYLITDISRNSSIVIAKTTPLISASLFLLQPVLRGFLPPLYHTLGPDAPKH